MNPMSMMPPMGGGGGGGQSNNQAMGNLLAMIFWGLIATSLMYGFALVSSYYAGVLVSSTAKSHGTEIFGVPYSMNFETISIGLGWLLVAILFIRTMFKGWWSVHRNAGKAITDLERKTYRIQLYFWMTMLLTLIMFLIRIVL